MADVVRLLRRLRDRQQHPRVPRLFRDRTNPFDIFNDEELYRRYRFRRPTIVFIVDLVALAIEHPTQRSMALTPLLQVLIFLQFLATGTFHVVVGQAMGVSKATAGRCVRRVATCLVTFVRRFIEFPSGQHALDVKRGFHAIAGFPNVIGCIDGTQIKIQAPHENEPDFVNRKNFHSINVQMACDHKFIITNCVANWPGSCHDSRIFKESDLCAKFDNGTYDGILLGDSGYPCRRYLMTPFLNTQDQRPKEKYNSSLCRTRVLIEQTFGILKRRFPCLSFGLRTNPKRACQYIVCCAILHNIGIQKQDIVVSDEDQLVLQGPDIPVDVFPGNDGFGIRDLIVQRYFT